jgi:mRNA interferase HigB
VRLISRRVLREFWEAHPKARSPLTAWESAIKFSSPRNPAELRAVFGSADFVRDLTVFNIGGNKFRLITGIDYRCQVVYVKHILTHTEYDEGKWKK